jgi:hypothetical protein
MALEIGWMQLLAASLMTLFMTTSAQNRFPEVALIPTETEVLEGESVELCVMLFNQDLLSESASLTLITNDLSGSLSDVNANSDYIPLREEIVFTPTGPSSICVTFQTLRDNVVEDTEALSIMLVNVSGVVANLRSVFLSILPANDRIVVDFLNTAFTVSEGDGTLNLSVQLTAGGIERAFPSTVEVEFSITDLTTEGSNDYVGPTSISFSAGEPVNTVKIFQIGIIDDQQVEGAERFALVIVSDSVQPVTTSGTGVAIVTLSDNDVASVALTSPPRSSVPEDGSEGVMSNVQVCVQLVLSYPIPLDRDVFVILDTEDVTTDSSDYSLPEALLAFQPGSTSTAVLCTTFSIVPDLNEEIDEEVVIRLFPVAPDVTFEGREKSIIVTIMNDDGEVFLHRSNALGELLYISDCI